MDGHTFRLIVIKMTIVIEAVTLGLVASTFLFVYLRYGLEMWWLLLLLGLVLIEAAKVDMKTFELLAEEYYDWEIGESDAK